MKYLYKLLIRVILCFIPISVFTAILIPLTKFFVKVSFLPHGISGTEIFTVMGFSFTIIGACVAGFAFYLFWILMLLTKDISIMQRVKLFLGTSALLFILNIVRIIFMAGIGIQKGYLFEGIHLFFYNIVSGLLVAFIWMAVVSAMRIRSVPVVDDIKEIYRMIKR